MSLAEYLDVLRKQALGINPAPGREVPSTFLFAFVDGRIVGRASIRHSLNHPLGPMTGHIGYAVLPEFRGRGHATDILRLALGHAREQIGIQHVLVTCDPGNTASIHVIEKNGGVFADERRDSATGMRKRRYWIDVLPYDG
ncbi:MAG: GNAT family N-acetyltransferase [Proteobacteria bacterium]|nr:GNAT family N-acetyltransferase [Pseudomonadota bacterium]